MLIKFLAFQIQRIYIVSASKRMLLIIRIPYRTIICYANCIALINFLFYGLIFTIPYFRI